jgi:hypothetical protein
MDLERIIPVTVTPVSLNLKHPYAIWKDWQRPSIHDLKKDVHSLNMARQPSRTCIFVRIGTIRIYLTPT